MPVELSTRLTSFPKFVRATGHVLPRIAAVAEDYLGFAGYQFSEASFALTFRRFRKSPFLRWQNCGCSSRL